MVFNVTAALQKLHSLRDTVVKCFHQRQKCKIATDCRGSN